jgi:hypothetical protein
MVSPAIVVSSLVGISAVSEFPQIRLSGVTILKVDYGVPLSFKEHAAVISSPFHRHCVHSNIQVLIDQTPSKHRSRNRLCVMYWSWIYTIVYRDEIRGRSLNLVFFGRGSDLRACRGQSSSKLCCSFTIS